ncbi:hypothetical protein HHK36_009175 [Tetracentron sinense]|uniref:Uncharacterized protein n=1 Tax=Tetracentron sinense TaxID=13715 RepID=A0A835DI41_TETSI|nr:hypothetical protein HHK36_009175 [Tetracentron sinense]
MLSKGLQARINATDLASVEDTHSRRNCVLRGFVFPHPFAGRNYGRDSVEPSIKPGETALVIHNFWCQSFAALITSFVCNVRLTGFIDQYVDMTLKHFVGIVIAFVNASVDSQSPGLVDG